MTVLEKYIKRFILTEGSVQEPASSNDLKFWEEGKGIKFEDSLGGKGYLHKHVYYDLMGDVDDDPRNPPSVDIVDWKSVPYERAPGKSDEDYKRRGFAAKVIKGIKEELGYDNFFIHIPSPDARAALKRLSEKGVITPDSRYMRGVSTDMYPIHYKIN